MTTQPPEIHHISGAPRSHSADLDTRVRRYLISMGIRTVCVILAVAISGPSRWVFGTLAVVLPYVAVVMANAVGERRVKPGSVPPVAQIALPAEDSAPRPVVLRYEDLEPAVPPAPDVSREGSSPEKGNPGSNERTA